VLVTDQSGNPVSGVTVEFEVTVGNGDVDPATVVTNSEGIAALTSWTLGPAAGANAVVASIPSAPAVGTETFNANGTVANSPPTAANDNNPTYTVDEDGVLNISEADGVLVNDTDPNADDLTAVNASDPAGGTVVLNADGSFTYTPDADFSGTDSFTYQANDGQASSNTATVTITVNPVNDDPGFTAGPDVSTSSTLTSVLGQTHAGWATGISPGPPDESSQTVSFLVSVDNEAMFQVLPQVDADGNLTYRPILSLATVEIGATITALDSGGATSEAQSFTISIDP
jgi:VCBS repeat-containing protein